MFRPLEGTRILDLSRLLPGPFASLVLADLGADVVKIESPGAGDYMRNVPPTKSGVNGGFWTLNRDKRSVEINLKSPQGRRQFLDLVKTADVVLESFRPGVIDRLGIGFGALQEVNSSVILCSISGFGQDGPYREKPGHDINYLALAGVLALCGEAGGKPMVPGVQIADIGGGALWAVSAINAALFARERNGEGSHIDISMTDGALAFASAYLGNADCGGPVPTRGSTALNGALACYNIYETKDGGYLAVGALEPKFWLAFNQGIGRDGSAAEVIAPADEQARIRAEIAEIILRRDRDAWMEILGGLDCCVEPVLELDELGEHPLHVARRRFFRQEHDGGESVFAIRMPIGNAAGERVAPSHGEHTDELLSGDDS